MPGKKSKVQQLQNKPFWIIFSLVFFTSLTVMFISTSTNLTGNSVVQFIAFAEKGSPLFLEVKNIEGVRSMDFSFLEDVREVRIFFEPIMEAEFAGTSYSAFEVSSPHKDSLGAITYTLKLNKQKLREMNIGIDEVKLYHEKKALPTIREKNERDYVYYSSTAPEMGKFVIGKAAAEIKANSNSLELISHSIENPEKTSPEVLGIAIKEPKTKQEGFFYSVKSFFKKLFGRE